MNLKDLIEDCIFPICIIFMILAATIFMVTGTVVLFMHIFGVL
jgi:hypothetical protein